MKHLKADNSVGVRGCNLMQNKKPMKIVADMNKDVIIIKMYFSKTYKHDENYHYQYQCRI